MVWVIGIGIGIFLLFAFPKQMATVILLLVVTAAGIGGLLYLQTEKRAEERKQRRESIIISAAYDVAGCSAEFPIQISIRNTYTQTMENLGFELEGYRKGYSSPVYKGPFYKSDRIIAPGETYTACWKQPPLDYSAQEVPPESLTWRASYSYADFAEKP